MFSEEDIKFRIINKLLKWRKWGGSHTENILNGLPSHLKGEKITKKVIDELVKSQWLFAMLKTKEIHYSLNTNKKAEIEGFIRNYTEKHKPII